MGHNESNVKKKSTKCFYKEIGAIPYKLLNRTPESSRRERSKYPRGVEDSKKIVKLGSEINQLERKRMI